MSNVEKFKNRFKYNIAQIYEDTLELYGEYKNNRDITEFRCKIHDYVFKSRPGAILAGHACPKCKGRSIIKTIDEHIEALKARNISLIGKKPTKTSEKCKFMCDIDGHIWETSISSLRKRGCAKCKGLAKLTNDEFILKVKDTNLGIYPIEEYINTKTKIKFKCSYCENTFKSTPNSVLSGGFGCPICSMSSGEKVIFNYLKSNNIKFIREFSPDWISPKRYDFLLTDYDIIIEFDGEQHFKYVKHFKSTLEESILNDIYKDNMAIKNNFKIIRVSASQIDCVKDVISFAIENRNIIKDITRIGIEYNNKYYKKYIEENFK